MEGFRLEPIDDGEPSIHVVELGSGKEVHAPDIAVKGLAAFAQAIEAAGGELVIPDDISELMPKPDEL